MPRRTGLSWAAGMAARAATWSLILLAALTLGAGGAVGREAATTTTVRVEVIGQGTVIDNKSQMNCGNGATTCRVSYTGTGSATFTATPADLSWTFTGWGGDCSGTTCEVTFDMSDADHEVIANFDHSPDLGDKTLTVTAAGDSNDDGGNIAGEDIDCDTGDTDCSTDVTLGSTLTIVETPDTGFVFAGWSGACSGSARSCTLTMDDNKSATGTFRKPRLSVNVNGNGTVTGGGIACTNGSSGGCSSDETAGEDVTLTATPAAGGSFTSWSGCTSSSGATCTVSMTGDRSVTANFSGGTGGGGGGPTTFPLSVSVIGNGTVSGGGLNCGVGGSTCSANLAAGTAVTLTATPGSGQSFQSWGGACSGSSPTCALTMTAAHSVTATFSGGSTAEVSLSLAVTGHGTVTGGGISCGNGKTACTAKVSKDSTVGLTATPAAGASFAGWGGACSDRTLTCTVEMDAAKNVTARFTGGSGRTPAAGSAALRSIGPPLVARTSAGFRVTLRFRTAQRGVARVRALRAGRVETALAFTAPAGTAKIGPFPVAKRGFYTFDLRLGGRILRWNACLGRCGEHAATSPFTLIRGLPTVVDAGALWSVTLHLRSSQAAGVVVDVFRGRTLAREVRFPIRSGAITPGALLVSPGSYRITLKAIDAYGRVRTLTWYALLP